MRVSWLLGAVVALGLSSAGNAASITILSPGDLGPPAGYSPAPPSIPSPLRPMEAQSPMDRSSTAEPLSPDPGWSHEGQGSAGIYATPLGDETNYMAVLGGGSETIAYSSLMNSFGLYWGSVDTYNSLAFYNGDTLVATITGGDVAPPLTADGGQTDYASNAFVLISALPQFDRVVAASSGYSFEFDNVVAGGRDALRRGSGALNLGHAAARLRGARLCGFRRSKAPISVVA